MYRLMMVSGAMSLLRMILLFLAALLFALKVWAWAAVLLWASILALAVGMFFERHDMISIRAVRLHRIADVSFCAALLACVCLMGKSML